MQESELERIRKHEVDFWKGQAEIQKKKCEVLQKSVDRYRRALVEYESARRFLSMSGDDPLEYQDLQPLREVK